MDIVISRAIDVLMHGMKYEIYDKHTMETNFIVVVFFWGLFEKSSV